MGDSRLMVVGHLKGHDHLSDELSLAAAKGLETVVQESRDTLGRTHLCSEIGRVGANKTFLRLLVHASAVKRDEGGLADGVNRAGDGGEVQRREESAAQVSVLDSLEVCLDL